MRLTHLDDNHNPTMVDVGEKQITNRTAIASGQIYMSDAAITAVRDASGKKGAVIQTAIVAGIMATKSTANAIPMCHSLNLNKSSIKINQINGGYEVLCEVSCSGKTGVEMEALHGASIALLTIYDMVKAIDKSMTVTNIKLLSKTGGKSDYARKD